MAAFLCMSLIRSLPSMNIFKIFMLLCQYVYYSLFEIDKYLWKGQTSKKTSRFKASCIFLILETLVLITLYDLVVHLLFGFPLPKNATYPMLWLIAGGVALNFFNETLIGSQIRTEYYRVIFDGWSKKKRLRWNIYVISIVIGIYIVLYIVLKKTLEDSAP